MNKIKTIIAYMGIPKFGIFNVNAEVVELGLLLDGSGSLGSSGWNAQVEAYQNIFNDDFYTTMINPDKELHVTVYRFDSRVRRAINMTHIDSNEAAGDFGDLIANIKYNRGFTSTGSAIDQATEYLRGNSTIDSDRMVIDISTDGVPTRGQNGMNAKDHALYQADRAQGFGIDVNVIGIGNVDQDYLADLAEAGGGFSVHSSGFNKFETHLSDKLYREINTATPEPSAYALMLLGLIGLVAYGRKQRQAAQL